MATVLLYVLFEKMYNCTVNIESCVGVCVEYTLLNVYTNNTEQSRRLRIKAYMYKMYC